MSGRCEPAEGLRDRDGWHWLEFKGFDHPTHGRRPFPVATQWWDRRHDNCWSHPFEGHMVGPEEIAKLGYRYLMPCPDPAELAALIKAAWAVQAAPFSSFWDSMTDAHAALSAALAAPSIKGVGDE